MENFGFNEQAGNLAGAATFNGARRSATISGVSSTNTSYRLIYSYFNAHFNYNQVGTCKIQGTNDGGTTYFDCASQANVAGVGLTLQVPVTYKEYRAQFVNGATGTTVQHVSTSFFKN